MFTAIVLSPESQAQCVSQARSYGLTEGLDKVFCHHVTLCLGAHPCPELLGQKRTLLVTHCGRVAGRVAAFRVAFASDSKNKVPHVTIATNSLCGAKPAESNLIEKWERVAPFYLDGTVQECR